MIERIKTGGVRGIDREYELSNLNLIVGPNGVGKSTIAISAQLCLLGYVAGSDVKRVRANIPPSGKMAPEIVIGGHTIGRQWIQKGSGTVSESVTVDGNSANRTAADGMIALAIGRGPHVFDVEAFFAASPAFKRRQCLSIVCTPDEQEALLRAEQLARDALNQARADRKSAEATMKELTAELAKKQETAGSDNPAKIQKRLEELEAERETVQKRIAQAEASAQSVKQRASIEASIAELTAEIADMEARIKDILEKSDAFQAQADALATEADKLIASNGQADTLDNSIVIAFCKALNAVLDEFGSQLQGQEAAESAVRDITAIIVDITPKPDKKAQKLVKQIDALCAKADECSEKAYAGIETMERIKEFAASKAETRARLQAQLAQYPAESLPLDENDVAAVAGFTAQIKTLREQHREASKLAALREQVERSRARVNEVMVNEDDAKRELETAIAAQTDMIDRAQQVLRDRSEPLLPYGRLRFIDEGSEFRVVWDMGEDRQIDRTSLSGGQRVLFDPVVGHVLAPDATVFIEAAELDGEHLDMALESMVGCGFQVVVLTCHTPAEAPTGWSVIEIPAKETVAA